MFRYIYEVEKLLATHDMLYVKSNWQFFQIISYKVEKIQELFFVWIPWVRNNYG